ncbi:MAG: hypothetical protein Q9220_006829 [cf. Caloplaca sp. 1 TL-2023]
MVKLPPLKEICTKELRLDAPGQKKLLQDAKRFRTNQLEISTASRNSLSSREVAKRYLDNGFAAKSIAPGRFLWPNSGVLPGVERIFAKLNQNAAKKDKRNNVASKSPRVGQEDVDTEDDELPSPDDIISEFQRERAINTTRREAYINAELPSNTTSDQRQMQQSAPASQALDDEVAVLTCGTKFRPEDPKDKTYLHPGRISDEPMRVPETRNGRKRRHDQPYDRRSRESTLVSPDPASRKVGIERPSRRRKAAKPPSVLGSTRDEDREPITTDVRGESTHVSGAHQEPSPEIERSSDSFRYLSSSTERASASGDMPAPKRRKSDHLKMALSFPRSDQEALLEEADTEHVLEEATRGNSPFVPHVPLRRLETRSLESAKSPDQRHLQAEFLDDGDDRSTTLFIAPGSRRSTAESEEPEGSPLVYSEDDRMWNHAAAEQDQVPASHAATEMHEMDVARQSVEDQAIQRPLARIGQRNPSQSLPPSIWILAVEASISSWHQWTRIPLEVLTIADLARGAQKQTQRDHIAVLKIKFSDRKQEWVVNLRPDDDLNFQDVKEMVSLKTKIRDIECSIPDDGRD